MPGPLAPSVQEKVVATTWFRLYVWLFAGAVIVAVGGAATV